MPSSGRHRKCDLREARAVYQNFLALWKDAYPDIPHPEGSQSGVCEAAMRSVH